MKFKSFDIWSNTLTFIDNTKEIKVSAKEITSTDYETFREFQYNNKVYILHSYIYYDPQYGTTLAYKIKEA